MVVCIGQELEILQGMGLCGMQVYILEYYFVVRSYVLYVYIVLQVDLKSIVLSEKK